MAKNFRKTTTDPSSYKYVTYWEFSTKPVYTSAVANRTLCELIKGGFIPHLESWEQKPTAEDRVGFLDQKLVSLHINLGVNDWLAKSTDWLLDINSELMLLASAFALAYTSPERLLSRSSNILLNIRPGEKTRKQQMQSFKRLEIKALEVSDMSTYRLIKEIQLLSAAAFCFIAKQDMYLLNVWNQTGSDLRWVYAAYKIDHKIIEEKTKAAGVLREYEEEKLQLKLRKVLTEGAHKVNTYLHSTFGTKSQ